MQGNIVENWLFQFGFNNGDAEGNGDGGFSAVTQASDASANEVKVAITSTSATSIDVDDTTVFTVGDFIQIDDEVMKITALTDSDTLAVTRGEKGTTAATHLINKQVYWHNFLPIAFSDITDNETFYHGAILNGSSIVIRESLNLARSTAKASNISVQIPDYQYQGSPISQKLFGGTQTFINQIVRVFAKIGAANKTQIGSFRLTDISSDGHTLQLSLTAPQPWNFIEFPQDKTETQVYIPVVYGDYTENKEGELSDANDASFCDSKKLYPCPNLNYGVFENSTQKDHIYFVYPKSYSSVAGPHFYDKNLDLFIQFTGTDSPNNQITTQQLGAHTVGVNIDMQRGFFLSRAKNPVDGGSANTWGNPDRAVDGNLSNPGATASCSPDNSTDGSVNTATATLKFDVPLMDGERGTPYYIYVKGSVSHTHTSGTTNTTLRVQNTVVCTRDQDDGTGTTNTTGYTIKGQTGYARATVTSDTVEITLKSQTQGTSPAGAGNGSAHVNDIVIQQIGINDIANEPSAALDKLSNLDAVYCGGDGLTASWDDGAITEIHEAHRDLLMRFGGLSSDDPTGWSDLESSKDWQIRYWRTEPIALKKALELLQYEGGFIGKFAPDGTYKYIHIKDGNYTLTSDTTLTKNDIADVVVQPTPLSEVITQMDISYRKHPAGKDYLKSVTFQNAAARKTYNMPAKENIKKINLDAYVGDHTDENDIPTSATTEVNDDWATYYDNIFGSVKLLVSCTIVNPKFYALEVGDVIGFDDMYPETPFSYNSSSWTANNMVFMITSYQRSLGTIKIQARQIK